MWWGRHMCVHACVDQKLTSTVLLNHCTLYWRRVSTGTCARQFKLANHRETKDPVCLWECWDCRQATISDAGDPDSHYKPFIRSAISPVPPLFISICVEGLNSALHACTASISLIKPFPQPKIFLVFPSCNSDHKHLPKVLLKSWFPAADATKRWWDPYEIGPMEGS